MCTRLPHGAVSSKNGVTRTTTAEKEVGRLYTPDATALDACGCTKEPLFLHINNRHYFLIMCVLHLLFGVGKYITKILRVHATRLTLHHRNKAQEVLTKAKTNIALKSECNRESNEISITSTRRGSANVLICTAGNSTPEC